MISETIYSLYYPLMAMVLLTLIVWAYMYYRRLSFVISHKVSAGKLHSPEQVSQILPDAVNAPSNNLKNLFEMPVLFYVVILLAAELNDLTVTSYVAAWSFVLFRVIHSIIHCSNGTVMTRFIVYILSTLSLAVLTINVANLMMR